MFRSDTIAAIATGMTNSGIGIIRISGDNAFNIIDKIFKSKKGNKKLSQEASHTVHYGYITFEDEIIDEVLVVILRSPTSYTTEDTVEINTHGGNLVMRRILQVVLKSGASLAEPGEFTKRAFLNGRIDLSQAESVMQLIGAKNEISLKNSVRQLNGELRDKIVKLRKKILHETAFIESALDDPEHYSLEGYTDKLKNKILDIDKEINVLIESASDGKIITEGINTVIVGKPNAGKSSLLNALLGEEKAIVTDIAGTTRDVITESIMIKGLLLNVMDTAGIRQTDDLIEEIGVKRALNLTKDADLVLYLADVSRPLDENDEKILDVISDKNVICLLNKSDLEKRADVDIIKSKIDAPIIYISALEKSGIDDFANLLRKMFLNGDISFNDQIYITNERHKEALNICRESIRLVLNAIDNQIPEDFLMVDLMNAYEQLGFIIGESLSEDLVDEIFREFCMGK